MKHMRIPGLPGPNDYEDGQFAVRCAGTSTADAWWAIIEPHGTSDEKPPWHDVDQWLYVISGTGEARRDSTDTPEPISTGSLVLICAFEKHEIRNTGDAPLVTINVFAPPLAKEPKIDC